MAVEHFDYVIIGAGSAGSVLAARLSEDPSTRVLLLEFGGSDRYLVFQIAIHGFDLLFLQGNQAAFAVVNHHKHQQHRQPTYQNESHQLFPFNSVAQRVDARALFKAGFLRFGPEPFGFNTLPKLM